MGDADIGGEVEELGVLAGAGGVEEVADHGERAGVVLDHAGEEEAVEVGAFGLAKGVHLFGGEHAGHGGHVHVHVLHAGHVGHGAGFGEGMAAVFEPALHELYLGGLGEADALAEFEKLGVAGAVLHEADHLDRLAVVHDHAVHEVEVGLGGLAVGGADGGRGEGDGGLAGCAGLEEGNCVRSLLTDCDGDAEGEECSAGSREPKCHEGNAFADRWTSLNVWSL